MKATLRVTEVECPHCKKDALGKNDMGLFRGDSEPYIEEQQSGIVICQHCKKEIQIDVKFTVTSDI